MGPPEMTFPEKLTALMDAARIGTDRELSEQIGVSTTAIWRWRVGKSKPDMDTGALVAKKFGVPFDWLADDSCDWPPARISPFLSEEEENLLDIIRDLGTDEAKRRLLML